MVPSQVLVKISRSRNLLAACLAHALHDGYTDGLYAFLPTWQAQFGLSYAGLAVVRALYYGTMGVFQYDRQTIAAKFAKRRTSPFHLSAAAGLIITALGIGFAGLSVGLVIAGIGSSIQHPRASLLVSETYGDAARGPLSVYNFSGDLGKAALPALARRWLLLIISLASGSWPYGVTRTGHRTWAHVFEA